MNELILAPIILSLGLLALDAIKDYTMPRSLSLEPISGLKLEWSKLQGPKLLPAPIQRQVN